MNAPSADLAAALPEAAREIEDFVSTGGWDQPPQLFALVPTAELIAAEPALAGQVDPLSPLTPVAQEPLRGALDDALAGIAWPRGVAGCAVVQEIAVLPPDAEAAIEIDGVSEADMVRAAAAHPRRREARLVAAVLRDGVGACVLRLRAADESEDAVEELVERPDLAPNLLAALHDTFRA
ncbi:MAG TPA: PPA1309 family protein [Pseudonocardiaceae bacterium]